MPVNTCCCQTCTTCANYYQFPLCPSSFVVKFKAGGVTYSVVVSKNPYVTFFGPFPGSAFDYSAGVFGPHSNPQYTGGTWISCTGGYSGLPDTPPGAPPWPDGTVISNYVGIDVVCSDVPHEFRINIYRTIIYPGGGTSVVGIVGWGITSDAGCCMKAQVVPNVAAGNDFVDKCLDYTYMETA